MKRVALQLAVVLLLPSVRAADGATCPLNITEGHCCPGGKNLGSQAAASTAECCQQCGKKKGCSVFTYNKPEKTCWMKGGVSSSRPGDCDCGHSGTLPPPGKAPSPQPPTSCGLGWKTQPGVGCAPRGGEGAGSWQTPAVSADACCGECALEHPKCQAW